MVVGALGLTLSSGILGEYVRCPPMCLQCVALLVWRCPFSLAVLPIPLFSAVFFSHSAVWLECVRCRKGASRRGGGGGENRDMGWTGQSGVLAPCDVTAVVVPGLP